MPKFGDEIVSDAKEALRKLTDSGAIAINKEILEKVSDPQAQMIVMLHKSQQQTMDLFTDQTKWLRGVIQEIFRKIDNAAGVAQEAKEAAHQLKEEVIAIRDKQTAVNGSIGRALNRLADVEKFKVNLEQQARDKANFSRGLIYIPTLARKIISNPLVWTIVGACGTWVAHHFKFIP